MPENIIVDVAPVRHGQFGPEYIDEYYGPFADCKECGTNNILPCKYCRMCGRKMDERQIGEDE